MSWSDCLINPVSCIASDVGGAAANSAWESFLRWTASGLGDLTATVFNTFSTSTTPRFDQDWWRSNLDLITTVSLPILVALFILQCISAVIHREPSRLGRALVGAVVGTAGVPFAVAVISSCGAIADDVSLAILGNQATADGMKRLIDITSLLSAATLGGFVLIAVLLALLALFAFYFILLLRDVALVAFVVFAPIAMASWTWSSTRHWLRRWVEVIGALLFSKIAMAVVFALGLSAAGAADQGNNPANLGTFLAGVLLVAMAAFAPAATFSFIHWAGDQGHAAAQAMKQIPVGGEAAKEGAGRIGEWAANQFGGSDGGDESPVVGEGSGEDEDEVIIDRAEADAKDPGDGAEGENSGDAVPEGSARKGAAGAVAAEERGDELQQRGQSYLGTSVGEGAGGSDGTEGSGSSAERSGTVSDGPANGAAGPDAAGGGDRA